MFYKSLAYIASDIIDLDISLIHFNKVPNFSNKLFDI